MTVTLQDIKALVEQRMKRQRKGHLECIQLAQGFILRKQGMAIILYHEDRPERHEICGGLTTDGEWTIFPVWYDALSELLGGVPEGSPENQGEVA